MNQRQSIDSLLSFANQATCINSDLMTVSKTQSSSVSNNMKKRGLSNNNNNMIESSTTISSDVQHQPLKKTRVDDLETSPYHQRNTKVSVPPSHVGITTFGVNDVLSGRGGGTNQHEGNCYFRSLISKNREKYLRARKNDKPDISMTIVQAIRQRNGRFLKKDEESGLWYEIGDAGAREKTSQALRQRAPEFRRKLLERDSRGSLNQQVFEAAQDTIYRNDLNAHLLGNSSSPIAPDMTLLHTLNETLRQIQILEAQRTLQLQQKINAAKLLELMLQPKESSSSSNNLI